MLANKLQKKIKKFQSVNWHIKSICEELMIYGIQKTGLGRSILQKKLQHADNASLIAKEFKPVDQTLFTLDANTLDDVSAVESLLKKYGICILQNFIDREQALSAGEEIEQFFISEGFLHDGKVGVPNPNIDYAETENYDWQSDLAQFQFYKQVIARGRPFINVRSRKLNEPDSGMADIFFVEKVANKYKMKALEHCLEAIIAPELDRFMSGFSGYKVQQSNLYYNAGVTTTRGPHIDNNSDQYKVFAYLSDVLQPEDGPYCYVPTSHINRNWMTRERLLNLAKGLPSTEVMSFPREQATKIMGSAGTVIISCQSGIHFGWQQAEDGRRVLIVGNYN